MPTPALVRSSLFELASVTNFDFSSWPSSVIDFFEMISESCMVGSSATFIIISSGIASLIVSPSIANSFVSTLLNVIRVNM